MEDTMCWEIDYRLFVEQMIVDDASLEEISYE
jgi:hypothetical protein